MNRLAAYTANLSLQHVTALKQILQYLARTKNFGITFSKTSNHLHDNFNIFDGFSDATYANHDDHKSMSGYVFSAAEGAITWKSKKQSTIALSTVQAEYVALSEARHEVCWLWNLFKELGYPQQSPTVIKGDNNSSIAMAKNTQFHNWSKHIANWWHWVREHTEQKLVTIENCQDPEQTADILTKAILCPKHIKHTSKMGLSPTWRGVLGGKLYHLVTCWLALLIAG